MYVCRVINIINIFIVSLAQIPVVVHVKPHGEKQKLKAVISNTITANAFIDGIRPTMIHLYNRRIDKIGRPSPKRTLKAHRKNQR